MKNQTTALAKTVEEAVALGAEKLGVSKDAVSFEVITEAKKGFLGIGSSDAEVKVTYVYTPLEAARKFAETLISDLELDAEITIHDDGNGEALLTVTGKDSSALIGHHGDTLDAFQYLLNLAANKKETDDRKYTRISVDIENYREKREETLRALARRTAAKAKKSGRSVSLEPMSSYERRIIHSEVQNIEGVSTNSVGAEGMRRVVIYPDGAELPTEENVKAPREKKRGERKNERRRSRGRRSSQKTESREPREPRRDEGERRAPKRSEIPYREPRKPVKAKDLDSYFEKLKEFSSTFDQ